jgi:hypothetical protein
MDERVGYKIEFIIERRNYMKKIVTLLLSGVMLATTVTGGSNLQVSMAATDAKSVPAIAAGEPYPSAPAANNPSDKELENAIKAVKAKITIPKEYSQFDYYFSGSSSYADSYWNLTWRNPSDSSYIQVNCDADYHITYYSKYDYSQKSGSIPAFLKKELKAKAEEFIKQIAPTVAPKLEYKDANYENIYSGCYTYNYQRIENGISFPDNSVTVWVDSVTGEVRSASISWLYDITIPSSDASISKDKATEILKQNMKMNLVYRMNYYRIYDSIAGNYAQKAYLAYEPDPSYISVDAKTGKVYLTRSEWVQQDLKNGTTEAAADSAAGTGMAKEDGGAVQLTEDEIKKITELEKLISKDKAIELVTGNKSLYIDKNLMTYTAYLNKSYSYDGSDSSYVWYIDLRDARPVNYEKDKDYYRAYASATVDAKTGKILSFNASIKSNYDEKTGKWNTVKIKNNKEDSRAILEKFLKDQVSTRFKKTKLVNQSDDYVAYYKGENTPVYGGYYYQYNRFNEGVEFEYNSIYGSVDGVTGKIYSFHTNWNDNVQFESTKDAMTADKALEKYLSKEGYHLVYEVNQVNLYDPNYTGSDKYYDSSEAYDVKYEVRLVYRPDVNPSYISPFTGDQLNYDGTPYTVKKPYVYEDVTDTPENREIQLLADMNIGFEGTMFYPNKNITVSEFNSLLSQIGYYNTETEASSAADILITREAVAYNLIERLGLKKIAELQGIYTTGYDDQFNIGGQYIGAVALAKGYGLMGADSGNNFNPKDNVTRAEAVHLIMNFINVQRKGIY